MADPFTPKFVDLAGNKTMTQGTGNIVLGAALAGHKSLATTAVGEQFHYCLMGVEKATESEVGRGTMTANGTIAREPVAGSRPTSAAATRRSRWSSGRSGSRGSPTACGPTR